ncbi:hypothetical protein Tco_0676545 [Tanacetum coccineum]
MAEPLPPDHVFDFPANDPTPELEDPVMEVEENLKEDLDMDINEDEEGESPHQTFYLGYPRLSPIPMRLQVHSAVPEAPHPVGRPLSVVASRVALHHREIRALCVRVDKMEDMQTLALPLVRKVDGVSDAQVGVLVANKLDETETQVLKMRDIVDNYPRGQVDALREEWKRISDKRTKNQAKTDKTGHGMERASVETEFSAIAFNDEVSSKALSYEPTVSSLNNEIDFRISFDDEDYTPAISCFDDLDFFKDFENEFPAIVYNDALTSKSDFLNEPTVSPQHIDEFNLKDETSLSKCYEEEQNVLYFNDLFSFNVIYPDDSKSDEDNDDDKIDIEHSSRNLSVKPLPDVINTDDGAYAHGSNKLLETRPRERNNDEVGGMHIF